jgi:hypothetical protein
MLSSRLGFCHKRIAFALQRACELSHIFAKRAPPIRLAR